MASKNVLMFGGTGAIGKHILKSLVECGNFDSVTIFTSPDTVRNKADEVDAFKAKGGKVIAGNVRDEQHVKAAYEGIDTVVSAVGRPVILDQINLIKWAEETPGIKRFFPSEYGTDVEYDASSAHEKPHQPKLRVRAFVRENAKRVQHTFLVTGPYPEMFIDSHAEPRLGRFDVRSKHAVLVGDGTGKIGFTTMPDVGKLVVAAIGHPNESGHAALKVTSFVATPREILTEFEKQTGERWKVDCTRLDELKELEKGAWDSGKPYATVATLRRIWAEGKSCYDKFDNGSIGAPEMETVATVVSKAIRTQSC